MKISHVGQNSLCTHIYRKYELSKVKLKEFPLTKALWPRNATASMAVIELLALNRQHRMVFLVHRRTGHQLLNQLYLQSIVHGLQRRRTGAKEGDFENVGGADRKSDTREAGKRREKGESYIVESTSYSTTDNN